MGLREDYRARRARALELRTAGKSYEEIAAELGYSTTLAAYRAILAAQGHKGPMPSRVPPELQFGESDLHFRNRTMTKAEREARQLRAVAMRAAGASYATIARLLDYSDRSAAYNSVQYALRPRRVNGGRKAEVSPAERRELAGAPLRILGETGGSPSAR